MYNIFRILIGVPDYSSSSLFLNEEEAIPPPPDKQNTPGILYNMYRRCNDGSALNLDDFFFFFGECCLKKMSLVQMYNIFRL